MVSSRSGLSRRRAFRLIELVVVLGIMILVLGIGLPLLLRIRDARNRSESSNNLKMIALATIFTAEENDGKLPPAVDAAYPTKKGEVDAEGKPLRTGFGPPLFHIIPWIESAYLERCPTYLESYSDEDGLYLAKRLKGRRWDVYWAPDDPTLDRSSDGCSYAVNELAFAPPAGKDYRRYPEDFPDGTSNTILYAEQYARQWGTWGTGWTEPRFVRPYTERDGQRVPKDPPFQVRPRVGRDEFDGERPQAFSSGGLMIALADGSVRPVVQPFGAVVFYWLCTPDEGKKPSGDW